MMLAFLLAWPIGLVLWANGKIEHVEVLSDAADTPGTVYLLAGSDAREDGAADFTEGQRADTVMLLFVPQRGTVSLVSIPRDTYVDIPGEGPGKLNSALSHGGPPLLIRTVEQLSGTKVDHYAEIGMYGVEELVDAVGGVELCLDYDFADEYTGLQWTAGCHTVDGGNALLFSRMRYADPLGDIGRTQRQQQVISAATHQVSQPSTLISPARQMAVVRAATGALTVDDATGIVDLLRMALAFRSATGQEGFRGTPPIADPDYRPGGVGSTVLLDEAGAAAFFQQAGLGTLQPNVAAPVE